MRLSLSSIRLLPVTMFVIAALLAMKSTQLVQELAPTAGAAPNVAEAPPTPPPPASKPSQEAEPPPVTDAERTLLLDLRQRRQELDNRDAAVAARESLLGAAEQKLAARVTELQALQTRLEALEAARKQREDASWQGLVKLYEAMKPRDAAAIFNDLEMPVLLQVVDRMKEAKAAPVLAAMQPDKAREVTTKLAQMRTQRDAPAGG